MRRLIVVNTLIFAVLASAAALAYYGYSYTAEASSRERAIIMDTMRELAEEKIIGIETPMLEFDEKIFTSIDPEHLPADEVVRALNAPIVSVFVLGEDFRVLPSGYVGTRLGEDGEAFRLFFEREVVPALNLGLLAEGTRGHEHLLLGGRPYLFSYSRRSNDGRSYFVVVEADLLHMVANVFPQFFGVRSPRLYQVVDDAGELVFGVPFRERGASVVELPFAETVSQWRLRVAQRDAGTQAARRGRTVIDFVLIGMALLVITSGMAILLYAMRRERKANELKSDFISNVSHELKTPLSIISMFGEMLAAGRVKTPAQATEYAEVIWRESVRLARLIDNVLDFAKIERGVDIYEFSSGDVGEIVARAVELSTHRLNAAGMTCTADIPPELPTANVDNNALTLAVLNLIDNAIKYAADGKRIEVATRAVGDRILITVRDHGPGIDAEEHERIFERFYRAKAVRLKPIRGSGIGLALVERIATAHRGGVKVDSAPGKGSTFTLWLPAEPARDMTAP
jgi:two-component system phosphate regulon sensor histidine kinase PhoR